MNTSVLFDKPIERGNAEFLQRISQGGLHDCSFHFFEGPRRTYLAPDKGKHQLDYLFLIDDLLKRCSSFEVVWNERV